MKRNKRNIFSSFSKKNRVKSLMSLTLASVLAGGAVTATTAVAAQKDVSNVTNNVNNTINHESDGLNPIALQSALAPAVSDATTSSYPPLTAAESRTIYHELVLIQLIINNKLKGMSLKATKRSFPAIKDKSVSFNDASENFAKDLGITGKLAKVFFSEQINGFLYQSDVFADKGKRLREGLVFTYSRSGLKNNGTSRATIKVSWRGTRPNEVININPAEADAWTLYIKVTGLGKKGKPLTPKEMDKFTDQLDKIQNVLNNFRRLSVNIMKHTIFLDDRSSNLAFSDLWNLEKAFKGNLGVGAKEWASFIKKLDGILAQPASKTKSGRTLRSQLIFNYSRTLVVGKGISRAKIWVTFGYPGNRDFVAPNVKAEELNINVKEMGSGKEPLTANETRQFTELLNGIQNKVNGLRFLSLTSTNNNLPAISQEKTVIFSEAALPLADDLGLIGKNSQEFFTQIRNSLSGSLSVTPSGHCLTDGLTFQYTRTGLNKDGTASALVKVSYISPTGERVNPTIDARELAIDIHRLVTPGINDEKTQLQNSVDAEINRFRYLHLAGKVTTVLPAVTNQAVTDLNIFGLNHLTLDNNRFIYLVSHSEFSRNGYYEILIKVVSKANQTIVSEELPLPIMVNIARSTGGPHTTSAFTGDQGKGSGSSGLGYIIGGTVGALGVIIVAPFAVRGVKNFFNSFKSRTAGEGLIGEELEMRDLQDVNSEPGSPLLERRPIVGVAEPSTPLLQDAAPIDDSFLGIGDGLGGTISEVPPQAERLMGEEALLALQDQIGSTQPVAFSGLGQRPLEAELGLVGTAEVDPIVDPALGRPAPVLSTRPVNTLLLDGASGNELNALNGIRTMGEDYVAQLKGRFGAAATDEVLQTVSDLSYVAGRVQLAGGIFSVPDFAELPATLQGRITAVLEQMTNFRGTSAVEAANVLRSIGGEINGITAEVLTALEARGLAVTSGNEILGSIFGRVIEFSQMGGLEVAEGLALVSAESAAEDGVIAFLEHLI